VACTLGIDLAAQDRNSAACLVEWTEDGAANVQCLRTGRDCGDDALVELMAHGGDVGIDSPMGWPRPFVLALAGYLATGDWPLPERVIDGRVRYDAFRLRETDLEVHRLLLEQGVSVRPLSVSSDTIAVVAFRCARLLALHEKVNGVPLDRTGERSRVFEVYPAAALASWGIDRKGYKARGVANRETAEQRRKTIVERIAPATRPWLRLGDAKEQLVASDHALDALLCALAARAASRGLTTLPRRDQQDLARDEGWIHVPRPDSLEHLAAPRAAAARGGTADPPHVPPATRA